MAVLLLVEGAAREETDYRAAREVTPVSSIMDLVPDPHAAIHFLAPFQSRSKKDC
jgi:hypothetical protein